MLSTRDLPQNKRPTQNENEVLEKKIPHKRTRKESRGRNTHISLNRIQKRAMKRDPEGHNTQRQNLPRRHKPRKYIRTQHRNTQIHKENLGGLQERY